MIIIPPSHKSRKDKLLEPSLCVCVRLDECVGRVYVMGRIFVNYYIVEKRDENAILRVMSDNAIGIHVRIKITHYDVFA